jgi:hypothetical protein
MGLMLIECGTYLMGSEQDHEYRGDENSGVVDKISGQL